MNYYIVGMKLRLPVLRCGLCEVNGNELRTQLRESLANRCVSADGKDIHALRTESLHQIASQTARCTRNPVTGRRCGVIKGCDLSIHQYCKAKKPIDKPAPVPSNKIL